MNLKERFQEAKETVGNTLRTDAERGANTDILGTLKKEHDEVKGLLSDLQSSKSSAERKGLVKKIGAALVPHSVAEEKVVYKKMIALSDKQAQVDGYEGSLEHTWAAKTLERLAAIDDAASSEHLATAKVLKELVEHHIKEEESNIWRDVRKHCSDEDRAQMNARYLSEKQQVPIPS